MARQVKSCLKTVVIVLLPTEFEKPCIFTEGPYVMYDKLDKAYGPLLRAHTINSIAKSFFMFALKSCLSGGEAFLSVPSEPHHCTCIVRGVASLAKVAIVNSKYQISLQTSMIRSICIINRFLN